MKFFCELKKFLEKYCQYTFFPPNEFLRHSGRYYNYMYVLVDGEVRVKFSDSGKARKPVILSQPAALGEMAFLSGRKAMADVVAQTNVTCLKIDDKVIAYLRKANASLASQFMRYLAEVSANREQENLLWVDSSGSLSKQSKQEVRLCRSKEVLLEVQKLRYQIYWHELERNCHGADHERKILTDPLDDFGHTFVCYDGGRLVGAISANRTNEGDIGDLADLYGMKTSKYYPDYTAITTKFVIVPSHRKSTTALELIAALCAYGMQQGIEEGYIDSILPLMPYYKALGFEVAEKPFIHPENGFTVPLKFNFRKYGPKVSRPPTRYSMFELYLKSRYYKLQARLMPNKMS